MEVDAIPNINVRQKVVPVFIAMALLNQSQILHLYLIQ
jgi:hypothetical protein